MATNHYITLNDVISNVLNHTYGKKLNHLLFKVNLTTFICGTVSGILQLLLDIIGIVHPQVTNWLSISPFVDELPIYMQAEIMMKQFC